MNYRHFTSQGSPGITLAAIEAVEIVRRLTLENGAKTDLWKLGPFYDVWIIAARGRGMGKRASLDSIVGG